MRTATNGRPRVTSAAEGKFIRVTSLRNCRPNKCFTEVKKQTHLNINCSKETVWIRPSWSNFCKPLLKDTNKKKRLAWAQKHEQWTLDRWKSVLWSDESKFEMFGSNCHVFVRRRVGKRVSSACVVPTEVWRRWYDGALLVTLSVIYLEFKAHLTSMATTAFCSDMPSHLVCA